MSRWSRIVVAIAATGCFAWAAAGLAGRAAGQGPEPLALHTLIGFGATLTLLLADIWIAVYLATGSRLARAAGIDLSAFARSRRAVYAGAIVAAALAITAFTLAGALYPGRMSPTIHVGLAAAALLAQLLFLGAAVRQLGRQDAAITTPR